MIDIYALTQATWPPVRAEMRDGWTIREGAGGGSRVSAATWDGPADATPDLGTAEAAMLGLGQGPLVMVRAGEDRLDAMLDAAGYAVKDPTLAYAIDAATIAAVPPPVTSFEIWPPLAIQTDVWAEAGVGPERRAVMDRVQGPKTSLLGRIHDRPAAAAFVAVHGDAAMLHALEVAPDYRRAGLARVMVCSAADWALRQGASTLALLVTRANAPANALYKSLGFEPVGHYHYRVKTGET
ncbi:GNAT family N-acetyltransferase [Rhodobacterales bacterium HKCCE2091]|nr:GNAT family N-acetyltransferase [Rhodobacterales bacterium HKCCE2091]